MGVSNKTKSRRLSQGLCQRCGINPIRLNMKTCEVCSNIMKEYDKNSRKRRKEQGLCQTCSEKAVENKSHCEKHLLLRSKKAKQNVDEIIKQGLCANCKKIRSPQYKRLCEECFLKHKENNRLEYINRQSQRICVYCGRYPSLSLINSCRICFFKNLSTNHFGSNSRYQELINLFESQNELCVVTKIPLILGKTASLDHIIPLSNGGTNVIENLRFVHLWINMMKMETSEEIFIPELKNWLKQIKID